MATEQRLIDQNKVYQLACAGCTRHGEKPGECYHDEPCERLIFAFTVAEPVDAVEVVHARWVNVQNGKGCCSNCHRLDSIDNFATHCRYCGAKMDGERKEGE